MAQRRSERTSRSLRARLMRLSMTWHAISESRPLVGSSRKIIAGSFTSCVTDQACTRCHARHGSTLPLMFAKGSFFAVGDRVWMSMANPRYDTDMPLMRRL